MRRVARRGNTIVDSCELCDTGSPRFDDILKVAKSHSATSMLCHAMGLSPPDDLVRVAEHAAMHSVCDTYAHHMGR